MLRDHVSSALGVLRAGVDQAHERAVLEAERAAFELERAAFELEREKNGSNA